MFITKKELNKRINTAVRKATDNIYKSQRELNNGKWNDDEHADMRGRIINIERQLGIPVEDTWQNRTSMKKYIKFDNEGEPVDEHHGRYGFVES